MSGEARTDARPRSRAGVLETIRHRPHSLRLRKVLFQIHMWVGISVGLYVLIAATTGAALVLRGDIQRAEYPEIFSAPVSAGDADVHIAEVVNKMAAAFPEHLLVGVSGPNPGQETFVGYILRDGSYRAVFADPSTGAVLGALPEDTLWEWLQDLHFYLFAGPKGLVVNGVGGILLFLLCVTGLLLWWPGVEGWRRNLTVDLRAGLRGASRDLHHMVGFWSVGLIGLLAITGSYFAFPQSYRTAIGALSPMTPTPTLESDSAGATHARTPELRELVAAAEARLPGSRVSRVSLARNNSDPVLVVMTREQPAERENDSYVYFYFDQFTGGLIHMRDLADRSWGDRVIPWIGRFHVGAFGGLGVKLLWFAVGLAPALLFLTGLTMWWRRVMASKW